MVVSAVANAVDQETDTEIATAVCSNWQAYKDLAHNYCLSSWIVLFLEIVMTRIMI